MYLLVSQVSFLFHDNIYTASVDTKLLPIADTDRLSGKFATNI